MNWIRSIFKTAYVKHLEEDNVRLLAENRALMNSLLGTAGYGPIETGNKPHSSSAVPAVHRPSLHQIQRKTEVESERRFRDRLKKWAESRMPDEKKVS
jgi:hypothetical protein